MVPIIGITCHQDEKANLITLNKEYYRAVEKAGGSPLALPYVHNAEALEAHCRVIDGLLLAGGVDIDPQWFGEQPFGTGEITPERDRYELAVTARFLAQDKPILAICRGLQVLSVCAGGDIFQDINTQVERVIKHMQQAPKWYPTHSVTIVEGTRLHQIIGKTEIKVNSFHHQASRKIPPDFSVCAFSQDGIIEGMESVKHRFVIGVQWHPEQMVSHSRQQLDLFREFVRACGKGGQK